jgi:hypothetical protein
MLAEGLQEDAMPGVGEGGQGDDDSDQFFVAR